MGIIMKNIAIAIDGPAGAGKSSIARAVALKLQYIYVDTGALYRAIGYFAARKGIDTKDATMVTACLEGLLVELSYIDGVQHVFVNDEDVSDKIRTPEMGMHASAVSAIPQVRDFLFDLQRDLARKHSVVMDGRDIGTVVIPNADAKIFLTASAEERANRRLADHKQKGEDVNYQELLLQIKERDHNDSTRAIAPLRQAEDAILIDSTGLTLEQAIAQVTDAIEKKLKGEAQ